LKSKSRNPKAEIRRGPRGQAAFGLRISDFGFPRCRWLAFLLALALPGAAAACRFNVRDLGFVKLEPVPYRLFVFINATTPPAFTNALAEFAQGTLRDAAIESELVNLDGEGPSGAHTLAQQHGVRAYPAFVLVAPDQRSLALPVDPSGLPPADFARAALAGVTSSPLREAVSKRIVEAYALVLLVEGDDPSANREARRIAEAGVAQTRTLTNRLPKAVKSPPEILTVTRAESARERIALWSLGLDTLPGSSPGLAVLYGRGKRLGPILSGPDLREARLCDLLGIIGQDCECFLDRSWMHGPTLPLRWDAPLQKQAADNLGFDAESPLIKAEVAAILAKGPNPNARPVGLVGGTDADLLGDREVALEEPPEPATAPSPAGRVPSPLLLSLAALAVASLGAGPGCGYGGGVIEPEIRNPKPDTGRPPRQEKCGPTGPAARTFRASDFGFHSDRGFRTSEFRLMSSLALILKEAWRRKANFLLSLAGLAPTVAPFVAFHTTSAAAKRETVRVTRDMGFNLRIIPRGTDLDPFWRDGFSDQTLAEDSVRRLAGYQQVFVSFNHLVATLPGRTEVRGVPVLLCGLAPTITAPEQSGGPTREPDSGRPASAISACSPRSCWLRVRCDWG